MADQRPATSRIRKSRRCCAPRCRSCPVCVARNPRGFCLRTAPEGWTWGAEQDRTGKWSLRCSPSLSTWRPSSLSCSNDTTLISARSSSRRGPPMTLANMRLNGVRIVIATQPQRCLPRACPVQRKPPAVENPRIGGATLVIKVVYCLRDGKHDGRPISPQSHAHFWTHVSAAVGEAYRRRQGEIF